MVIAQPINLNVSCKLHPYSLQKTRSPQGHVFPSGLEKISRGKKLVFFKLLQVLICNEKCNGEEAYPFAKEFFSVIWVSSTDFYIYICRQDTWQIRSSLGRYMFRLRKQRFKLAVIAWFVYLLIKLFCCHSKSAHPISMAVHAPFGQCL